MRALLLLILTFAICRAQELGAVLVPILTAAAEPMLAKRLDTSPQATASSVVDPVTPTASALETSSPTAVVATIIATEPSISLLGTSCALLDIGCVTSALIGASTRIQQTSVQETSAPTTTSSSSTGGHQAVRWTGGLITGWLVATIWLQTIL
ncbi:uncharacterized protein PV09_08125 [Verruconis gallopava]|uniref:Uncharacterized protein n=1 Tax=Verruconis gallopava TaxID=253628 RepID=A0A0D2A172_9PEZI|nr:uncharacterized protein PV09_08125 [Verruconis gallopava]KIW00418.1 hypothetical protein PV09_08125 [Verruconis gallopava]